MGSNLCSDSAMEQFVFFRVKASVAAVNIESSCCGSEVGFWEDVLSAGPSSVPGEGGGVGYASCCWVWEERDSQTERKFSRPRTLGRSHW
jgi:hypothetical protein